MPVRVILQPTSLSRGWHKYKIIFQSYDVVHKFVNDVYLGLCSNEFLLDINLELATVLGMLSPDDETVLEQFQETVIESEDMNMVRKKSTVIK